MQGLSSRRGRHPAGHADQGRARTLIADITLLPEPDHTKVRIGIRWHTGATDELSGPAAAPGPGQTQPSAAVDLVRRLGPTTDTTQRVERLNAAGLTTGHGRPFDDAAVAWIRHAYKIPAPDQFAAGEISVVNAARRLGCSTGVVYYWLKTGQLKARRGAGNRLCITWTTDVEADCRRRIAESAHL